MVREGEEAPEFELESEEGKRVRLTDFRGRKVVVYFYPKDNTPGCTREAVAFSAVKRRIETAGASVIGISKDSVKSHQSFREKHDLKILLLSDPDLAVHKAYGAFGEKTLYGKKTLGVLRTTFIVDEQGKVAKAFAAVKVDGHEEQVLAALSGDAKPAPKKPSRKSRST